MKINKNKSDKTIESYGNNLHMFIAFMKLYKAKKEVDPKAELTKTDIHVTGEKFFNKITLTDLDAFINYLDSRGNKASSKVQRINSIQSFYNYLYKYKIISENVAQDLEKPKVEKREPIFLNIEDSKKLLETIENSSAKNSDRDHCIFTLFLHCGLRISELINIKFKDIDFIDNTLRVYGKGDKERIVYLDNACIKTINNYLSERKEIQEKIRNKEHQDLLFISNHYKDIEPITIQQLLKKILKEAGINNDKITPHKLRHTFATLQHDNGMDIVELQQVLGHEQITTTQIYVHVNNKTIKNKMNNNPLND
jgi:Site-specific recombinase XerD